MLKQSSQLTTNSLLSSSTMKVVLTVRAATLLRFVKRMLMMAKR
nr:MAG TPA: hypothetical protein [Bacteriophage sp.]